MKTVYPKAIKRFLPEAYSQPIITPTQIIVHSAADGPNAGDTSLFRYFSRLDVRVESHFQVMASGKVEQYMPTNRRADANGDANARAISIETESDSTTSDKPWTEEQWLALVNLIDWLTDENNIPVDWIPLDTYMRKPGIGYHSMNIRGNHQADGAKMQFHGNNTRTEWSSAFGKTCPGLGRAKFLEDNLMEALGTSRMFTLVGGSLHNSFADYETTPLGIGDFDPEVGVLQRDLEDLGYYEGEVDDDFGPLTHSAVVEFQKDLGLLTDGLVGPQTRSSLTAELEEYREINDELNTTDTIELSGDFLIYMLGGTVQRAFSYFMGRPADREGVVYWAKYIQDHGIDEFLDVIQRTGEAQSHRQEWGIKG